VSFQGQVTKIEKSQKAGHGKKKPFKTASDGQSRTGKKGATKRWPWQGEVEKKGEPLKGKRQSGPLRTGGESKNGGRGWA